jgi:hypothetical protein
MSNVQNGSTTCATRSLIYAPSSSGLPANGYVAEDGVTYYVAEDGATFYVREV